MARPQDGILLPCPMVGRFMTFGLHSPDCARPLLGRLGALPVNDTMVVGLGEPLAHAVGAVEGLRAFPALSGPGCAFPSTQGAVWVYLRAADPGAALDASFSLRAALGELVRLEEDVATFQFRGGRDLSGYVDGTENPKDDAAVEAALLAGGPLDGSSFVAVQRYRHDLARMRAMAPRARDHLIGRSMETNEELADAPASAHVKRAAQESFDPPAFMLRRSMPWGDVDDHGLYFVAFGASLSRFERVLRRMAGLDDGIVDGVMQYSRALTGGYYWCPPVDDGRLDLGALL